MGGQDKNRKLQNRQEQVSGLSAVPGDEPGQLAAPREDAEA